NPCSIPSPCRTFGAAIAAVATGGEIVVLDSGGYGPFTIAKAVTINVPSGVYAGIAVSSGVGITISLSAGDTLVLRGLTINGTGGMAGIAFTGGTLTLERCVISGVVDNAIEMAVPGGANGRLSLTDSTFCNCGGTGVVLFPLGGGLTSSVHVDHCRF